MAVLERVKPGAKPGQVILAIDLSIAGSSDQALDTIKRLDYTPEIRHVSYPSGVHVLAVLRDEHATSDDHLLPEWEALLEYFPPECVHLWRGLSGHHETNDK
jgi:hypothetical protein